MTTAYVQGRVREAIAAAKGSRTMAQQLLMTWANEDPELLRGMAQPFLKAIVAAALQGEVRRAEAPQRRSGGGGRAMSRDALIQVLSKLGDDEPGASPAGGGAKPAGTMAAATITVNSKTQAAAEAGTVDHQQAMKAIAKAFAAKKF